MTVKHLSWLLLVAGAVIWYVESSRGEYLMSWEAKLPGAASIDVGMGEYMLAAGVGLLLYQKVG